mmetsp:Transcript_31601/g.108680  ORF Transcript_31601/g.108680 Transcript_31601/m.108680 type:complete len:319 (-) Transcript_31601:107-1063(-)
MLLLFLDLRSHDRSNASFVGGKSGGLFNDDVVRELEACRLDGSFSHRVAFAYLDGHQYADRMKSLGLFGGAERLPALAFNTNEVGVLAPYPDDLPIERGALRDFIGAFLTKRLRTTADSKRYAVQRASSTTAAVPKRRPRKEPPAERVGISEQFGSSSLGVAARGFEDHVVELNASNFQSIALDETKDVLVLFHSRECASCAGMAVYYKKLAERFADFGLPALVVARFDASDVLPPLEGHALGAAELPTLLMLPATRKRPPFIFYSGISKVQPMMRWVQQVAAVPFHLPELCHLTPEDRDLYKMQVAEREAHRATQEL